MNLSIRITEKHGDTERTILIGEAPKPVLVQMQAIDLGQFLGATAAEAPAPGYVKLDAKFQPLPADTTDAVWAYTHDRSTDLVWTRKEIADEVTHADAVKACEAVGHGFRMPTIRERLSIVDYTRHEPAIDVQFFDSPKSGYSWTSTDAAWSKDKSGAASAAWVVGLRDGLAGDYHRNLHASVRAVRSGVPAGQ